MGSFGIKKRTARDGADRKIEPDSASLSHSLRFKSSALRITPLLLFSILFASFILRVSVPRNVSLFQREAHFGTSIDRIRLDIAAVSIDLMKEGTVYAANESSFFDIGPFYDVVDSVVDQFGARRVYVELFESNKFVSALDEVVTQMQKDLSAFERGQGKGHATFDEICSGCKWWLDHYVGAIAADKILSEGSLLLDHKTNERAYDVPSLMKEMERIRLASSDSMIIRAQRGLIWQFLAKKKTVLDSYPIEEAKVLCPDEDELANECGLSVGHSIFYAVAKQQLVSKKVSTTYL